MAKGGCVSNAGDPNSLVLLRTSQQVVEEEVPVVGTPVLDGAWRCPVVGVLTVDRKATVVVHKDRAGKEESPQSSNKN